MTALDFIATLRGRIDETLDPLLADVGSVALLDFPSYANVGDSAVWLGTLAYLDSRHVRVAYTAARENFDASHLRARLGDGVVLLTGGGNFGDVWEAYQRFREHVVTVLPNHRIIQLPQSIRFNDTTNLHRARQCLDAHSDLTILVRDRESLDLARNTFRASVCLCPDMAFRLGPLERVGTPTRRVLRLVRQDRESASAANDEGVDWIEQPSDAIHRLHDLLSRTLINYPRRARALRGPLSALYGRMARGRLEYGVGLLSSGETVVTDRLHGHILCLLLGIRHFVFGDRHGKIERFRAAWTGGSPLATWCSQYETAVQQAEAWSERPVGAGT